MKKVYVVTGGAGFIGSNIVHSILDDSHCVYVIDDLSTGSLANVPIETTLYTSRYEAVLPSILEKTKIDGIFHLGAASNSLLYRGDRQLVADAIKDFITILEVCKVNNIRLVYVSTSSLYNGNETPWHEDMQIIPKDFYSEVRYTWERLASVYHDFYGVESIGLRLFSVYGIRERAKGIYANLLSQLLWANERNEVFEIYGNGTQERDTVYVSDVVKAFRLAMDSNIKLDVFNIGTGKNYTLNEMADITHARVRYVDNPMANYVMKTLADTTKTEKLLGFKASVSIEEGLQYMREENNEVFNPSFSI